MKFILGIIVGLLLVAAAGFVYFRFGFAPIATSAPPMPFEKTLAGWALDARIDREMPKAVPIAADSANLMAGARTYVENCSMCHGLPEKRTSVFHEAMFPRPPQLFHGTGVTDDPAGETYWKVTNGIRMTGMPSFDHILNEIQRWQVSLLLADAARLPGDVTAFLRTAELTK
jgi:thiosulfate dehydrogenase